MKGLSFQMLSSKVSAMLRTLEIATLFPSGGGWFSASQIRTFSGVSEVTTYRYLKKLETLGMVSVRFKPFAKRQCKQYHIRAEGRKFLSTVKELI